MNPGERNGNGGIGCEPGGERGGVGTVVTPEILPAYPLQAPGHLRGIVVPRGALFMLGGVVIGAVLAFWIQAQIRDRR